MSIYSIGRLRHSGPFWFFLYIEWHSCIRLKRATSKLTTLYEKQRFIKKRNADPSNGHLPNCVVTVCHHLSNQVEMESGRYLVGEAGIFVTRVIDVKPSRAETTRVSPSR